jgi:hypothetical protein
MTDLPEAWLLTNRKTGFKTLRFIEPADTPKNRADWGWSPLYTEPYAPKSAANRLDQAAKAIYLARFPDIEPEKLASDFEWFHEGKGNPDSSVHYSNVALAYRDASAAFSSVTQDS